MNHKSKFSLHGSVSWTSVDEDNEDFEILDRLEIMRILISDHKPERSGL